MKIIELSLPGIGWVNAVLFAENNEISIEASYLSDAPADLLKATITILKGSKKEAFYWLQEPGQYGWLFTAVGQWTLSLHDM